MNDSMKNSMIKTLQKEFIRRSLIQFFEEKGYDNFLVKPYPPSLVDLPDRIPVLNSVVEIKYFLEDIDMQENIIKVGWNVFALGNKRIFLGYTLHKNLNEIDNNSNNIDIIHDGPINIKNIIESLVKILGESTKMADAYKRMNLNDTGVGGYKNLIKPRKPIPNFQRKV